MSGSEVEKGAEEGGIEANHENEIQTQIPTEATIDGRILSAISRSSVKQAANSLNLRPARLLRTPVNDPTLITEFPDSDDNWDEDAFIDDDSLNGSAIFDDMLKAQVETGQEGGEEDDPGALSDETELEVDIEGLLNPEKISHDTTGRTDYIRACSKECTTPISVFLRNIQAKEFVMRYRGLGPKGAKAISIPLESNTTIERLDLEGNSIEPIGAVHLANMLKENYYISEMTLAENMIGKKGTAAICEVLQDNHTVLKLDLSGNGIDNDAAIDIHEMLKKNTALKYLSLSHNELGNPAAKLFKDVLAENESLETLDLSWNQIRTQGTVWLAEGIQENIGLKYLNLSMNGMGVDGAREMGKALKQNRSLLELDISYNRIPMDACPFLASGIQTNDTLQTLKMGSNPLGEDGSLGILIGVEKNDSTSLRCLDLTNIVVTAPFERLRLRLEKESNLRVIHGGVVGNVDSIDTGDVLDSVSTIDPLEAFRRDPMSKLKQYVQDAGLRMIDLFKQLDKDNSMTVSRKEFVNGITKANIGLSDEQLKILLEKMDKDHDGEIDFGELVVSEKEYRVQQRNVLKLQDELQKDNISK